MDFCSMPKQVDFAELPEREFNYLNSANLSFIDKVLTMTNMLQLTHAELHERHIIVKDLIDLLKPFYPDCDVMIFGSSMNGLGFRGCDLDLLFLPFPGYCNLDFVENDKKSDNENDKKCDNENDKKCDNENDKKCDNENDKKNDNEIDPVPSLFEVQGGSYPREKLLCMKEEHHLKFVQRILRKKRNIIRRILYIPAKCPILNIQFARSYFTCDFSASNRLVTSNTELLWLFGTLDARVRPLIIVLRYWAKSLGFIAKSLLSSYAFTLLVIFYLQNIDPPILPSVENISKMSGYSRVIDGWETAVCRSWLSIRSQNSTDIAQLLIGFFDFYWNFDFIQNVVSIYHGKAIPVKELKESTDDRIKLFKVTPLSIQDAFILSHNVSRNSDMKSSFKLTLLIAKKLMLQENIPFQSLFKFSLYQEEMATMFEATKKNLPHFTCFPVYLNYNMNCRLGVTNQFHLWYRKVQEIVLDVLQYGLLAECEVVDKAIWSDKHPIKKKKKIHTENVGRLQLIMSIQCTFHYDTICGRNNVKEVDLEDDKDVIELPSHLRKEYKISKHLIKKKIGVSPISRVICQCYKYSSMQMPDVIVTFSSLVDIPNFNEQKGLQLSSFVKKTVRNMLEQNLIVKAGIANERRRKKPLKRNSEHHMKMMKNDLFVKAGMSNEKKTLNKNSKRLMKGN